MVQIIYPYKHPEYREMLEIGRCLSSETWQTKTALGWASKEAQDFSRQTGKLTEEEGIHKAQDQLRIS